MLIRGGASSMVLSHCHQTMPDDSGYSKTLLNCLKSSLSAMDFKSSKCRIAEYVPLSFTFTTELVCALYCPVSGTVS